jgi:CRISPR-associated protein Cmr1
MGFAGSRYVFGGSLATPMIVGWFEPGQLDPLGVRATEVKGLWRWWARAFVAGAMYDLDLLEGDSRGDAVLRPSKSDVRRINYVVGGVMGLGMAGDGGAEASRFTVYTELIGSPPQPRCIDLKRVRKAKRVAKPKGEYNYSASDLQRIRLLSIDKERICYYEPDEPGTRRFNIVVEKRRSSDQYAELVALKILVVALQLSGIGNGGRRGLGSLNVSLPSDLKYEGLEQLISDAYESTLDVVKRVVSRERWGIQRRAGAPPLPLVSRGRFGGLPITRIMVARVRDFSQIHNFFVRSERCRVLTGSSRRNDDLRNNLNAWVLGLPRHIKRKKQREEYEYIGYKIASERISRRASPILVAYHTKDNSLGEGAFISILFSADWPKEIEWFGAGAQTISVDLDRLCDAYKVAVSELQSYLQKVGAQITYVWP